MKRKPDSGFSLAALIFFLTAASILIAAAVPAYQTQAKREREEELIFRGEEYTRAIQKYQRKFGIYPTSIDALVETNGLRFVRRAYKDPITGKDFRLITINPDGSIGGSVVASASSNTPLFGDTQRFGDGAATVPATVNTNNNNSGNNNSFRNNNSGGNNSGFTNNSGNNGGFTNNSGNSNTFTNSGANNSNRSPATAGGIIGVASDSKETSLKIYNKREKYNEWEFVAILGQRSATPPTTPPPVTKSDPPPNKLR